MQKIYFQKEEYKYLINILENYIGININDFQKKLINKYSDKKEDKEYNQYILKIFLQIFKEIEEEKNKQLKEEKLEEILLSLEKDNQKLSYIEKQIRENSPYIIFNEEENKDEEYKKIVYRIKELEEEKKEVKEEELKIKKEKTNEILKIKKNDKDKSVKNIEKKEELLKIIKKDLEIINFELKYKIFYTNNYIDFKGNRLTQNEITALWNKHLKRKERNKKNMI